MQTFVQNVSNNSFQIVATIITMIVSLFSAIIVNSLIKRQQKTSGRLIESIESEEKTEFLNAVNQTILTLPEGLSADEYFRKLKSALLEVNYEINKEDSNGKIDELIQNHHEQALEQATVQFWFSLSASVIGFLFIILIIVFVPSGSPWYDYVLKVIPGIVIEAVSLLFFSQSKETRERSSDFLNRLREDRQIFKSIIILDSIGDEKIKSAIKANIALHMSGIQELPKITYTGEN